MGEEETKSEQGETDFVLRLFAKAHGPGRGRCISCFRRDAHDDKALEELIRAVARLQLDWPQKQETPKRTNLEDRILSGG